MQYISAHVKTIIRNSVQAKKQVMDFLAKIKSDAIDNKLIFLSKIDDSLADAKIKDGQSILFDSIFITTSSSKSFLEIVNKAVTSTINKAAFVRDQEYTVQLKTPKIIESYTNAMNSVIKEAKASSANSNSRTFVMNRLSPGIFIFLQVSVTSIKDTKTLDEEPISTMVLYYNFIFSNEDFKKQNLFDRVQSEKENYLKLINDQIRLLDDLSNGKVDFETWKNNDQALSVAIDKAKDKLNNGNFE
jgi:hypothetical protein